MRSPLLGGSLASSRFRNQTGLLGFPCCSTLQAGTSLIVLIVSPFPVLARSMVTLVSKAGGFLAGAGFFGCFGGPTGGKGASVFMVAVPEKGL